MEWHQVPTDATVWTAVPDPACRLDVWQGGRGWDWHVLDLSNNPGARMIAQQRAEPDADAAKAMAEKHYWAYREARRHESR